MLETVQPGTVPSSPPRGEMLSADAFQLDGELADGAPAPGAALHTDMELSDEQLEAHDDAAFSDGDSDAPAAPAPPAVAVTRAAAVAAPPPLPLQSLTAPADMLALLRAARSPTAAAIALVAACGSELADWSANPPVVGSRIAGLMASLATVPPAGNFTTNCSPMRYSFEYESHIP